MKLASQKIAADISLLMQLQTAGDCLLSDKQGRVVLYRIITCLNGPHAF